MSDTTRCVVLYRETRHKDWQLICITERKSVAWRSAASIERQDRESLNVKSSNSIVVLESDYYSGKIVPIKPPAGFDLELPVGELKKEEPVRIPAKIPSAIEITLGTPEMLMDL